MPRALPSPALQEKIIDASRRCDVAEFQSYLKLNLDFNFLNHADGLPMTPLNHWVAASNLSMVTALLCAGAHVNPPQEGFWETSPLLIALAAPELSVPIVKKILRAGADVEWQNVYCQGVLHVLLEDRRYSDAQEARVVLEVLDLLLSNNSVPLHQDVHDFSPLNLALLAEWPVEDCYALLQRFHRLYGDDFDVHVNDHRSRLFVSTPMLQALQRVAVEVAKSHFSDTLSASSLPFSARRPLRL